MISKVLSGEQPWISLCGESTSTLKSFPDACLDALVTDPPAGISLLGRKWDDADGEGGGRGRQAFVGWLTPLFRECFRVLKPGAHGLVWALPRTAHWTAVALEDAGFELIDQLHHLFSTGFPKGQNISKSLDKAAGAPRELAADDSTVCVYLQKGEPCRGHGAEGSQNSKTIHSPKSLPSSPEAQKWDGHNTVLKPAHENWLLVRKPIDILEGFARVDAKLAEIERCLWSAKRVESPFAHSLATVPEEMAGSVRGPVETPHGGVQVVLVPPGPEDATNSRAVILGSESEGVSTSWSIVRSWRRILADAYELTSMSITRTSSAPTIDWRTLSCCLSQITPDDIQALALYPSGAPSRARAVASLLNGVYSNCSAIRLCAVPESAGGSSPKIKGSVSPKGGSGEREVVGNDHENWWLIRKPLDGTVVQNILKHGVGGLNIKACRVKGGPKVHDVASDPAKRVRTMSAGLTLGANAEKMAAAQAESVAITNELGRYPSNLIFSHSPDCVRSGSARVRTCSAMTNATATPRKVYGKYAQKSLVGHADADGKEEVEVWDCAPGCVVAALDAQSGVGTSGTHGAGELRNKPGGNGVTFGAMKGVVGASYGDTGAASRFFSVFTPEYLVPFLYEAKAGSSEKDVGCNDLYWKADSSRASGYKPISKLEWYAASSDPEAQVLRGNMHPTPKSLSLCSWLIRLVTPPGGVVLDCFLGSGSIGLAAMVGGFRFVGIEREADYVTIARARLAHWEKWYPRAVQQEADERSKKKP